MLSTGDALRQYWHADGLVGALFDYYDGRVTLEQVKNALSESEPQSDAVLDVVRWTDGLKASDLLGFFALGETFTNLRRLVEEIVKSTGTVEFDGPYGPVQMNLLLRQAVDADMPTLYKTLKVSIGAGADDTLEGRMLKRAVQKGSNSVVRELLGNAQESAGESLLFDAVISSNPEAIRLVTAQFPALAQSMQIIGSVFQAAVQVGNEPIVAFMLKENWLTPQVIISGFSAVLMQNDFTPVFNEFMRFLEGNAAGLSESMRKDVSMAVIYAVSLEETQKLRALIALHDASMEPDFAFLKDAFLARAYNVATALMHEPFNVPVRTGNAGKDVERLSFFAQDPDWLECVFSATDQYRGIDQGTSDLFAAVAGSRTVNVRSETILAGWQEAIAQTTELLRRGGGGGSASPGPVEAFLLVTSRGHWEAVPKVLKALTDEGTVPLKEQAEAVRTGTVHAVVQSNLKMLKLLLPVFVEFYTSVDAVTDRQDYTLLISALRWSRNANIARHLIECAGADPSRGIITRDAAGAVIPRQSVSPLLVATFSQVWFKDASAVEYLLSKGADPTVGSGMAVLFAATQKRADTLKSMLMSEEYDPVQGGTPLIWFAQHGPGQEDMLSVFGEFLKKIAAQGDAFTRKVLDNNRDFFEISLLGDSESTPFFRNAYYALLFNGWAAPWKKQIANALLLEAEGKIFGWEGAKNLQWFKSLTEELPGVSTSKGKKATKRKLFEETNDTSSSSSSSSDDDNVGVLFSPERAREAAYRNGVMQAARDNDVEGLRALFLERRPDAQIIREAFLESAKDDDDTVDESLQPEGMSLSNMDGGNAQARGFLVYTALAGDPREMGSLAAQMLTVRNPRIKGNMDRIGQAWKECVLRSVTTKPLERLVQFLNEYPQSTAEVPSNTGKDTIRKATQAGKLDTLRVALRWSETHNILDSAIASAVTETNAAKLLEFSGEQSLPETARVALQKTDSVSQMTFTRALYLAAVTGSDLVVTAMRNSKAAETMLDEVLRDGVCAIAANEEQSNVIAALLPPGKKTPASPALNLAMRRALANPRGQDAAKVLLERVSFDEQSLYTQEDVARCLLAGSAHGVRRLSRVMGQRVFDRYKSLAASEEVAQAMGASRKRERSNISKALRSLSLEGRSRTLDEAIASLTRAARGQENE